MKNIMISLNTIALVVAIYWFIKTDYGNEPLIAIITLTATLIGLLFTRDKSKIINIKGNKNLTRQANENSKVDVEGDENKTYQ